ncbi:hypothetical protein VFPBJ_08298 [Purpureocillium lilacinum]|uniref:2EXR domain-containing protein n=1 Tax=Purpureocillium lilacinum TaxID=33203 RepID=A0A179GIZ6_PURLI|nr:hypothetical protein VFPBJ_08298 [Purpureocillium lilacinum]GJN74800.1 hypothetical protein PLICBS_008893 [Purpureocillium lilacinum]
MSPGSKPFIAVEEGHGNGHPSSDFHDPASPTLDEVLRKYKRAACSGVQCPHPANAWFRDPRPETGRGQRKSNTRVLRELVTELAPDAPEVWSVVERFQSNDDLDLLKEENEASLFPQFQRLPAELQEWIWRAAIPRRWVHFAQPQFPVARYPPLPVPQVASVCRAARHVVLSGGANVVFRQHNTAGWSDDIERPPDASTTRYEQHIPAGFLNEQDLLYITQEPYLGHVLGEDELAAQMDGDVSVTTWSAEKVLGVVQDAASLAVFWQDPCFYFLGQNSPDDRSGQKQIARWSFLKGCAALQTLFVNFRDQPVTLQLPLMGPTCTTPQERRWNSALNLVKLYDDDRLAQLTRLETSPTRTSMPRYRYDAGKTPGGQGKHPGRCLNCERVQWELHHKHVVERFWLQLWADELCEAERAAVFPSRKTYDASHPWTRSKMKRAPEFVPVVAIRIEMQTE